MGMDVLLYPEGAYSIVEEMLKSDRVMGQLYFSRRVCQV